MLTRNFLRKLVYLRIQVMSLLTIRMIDINAMIPGNTFQFLSFALLP